MKDYKTFDDLYDIVTRLRAPDGCPWDRKQTLDDMKSYLLEESYETVSAVQDDDSHGIKEELGDVLLIISMMMLISEEKNLFSRDEVFSGICSKLVRRHPHVFGEETIDDPDEVKRKWEEIKVTVEGRKKKTGVHAVSTGFPPLERSYKIQKKAAKAGFDWPDASGPIEKIEEELAELREARVSNNGNDIEEEIGDLLFSVVNVARKLKIDPMTALHRTNEKFLDRYAHVERMMAETNQEMSRDNLEIMDRYWNLAKKQGSRSDSQA